MLNIPGRDYLGQMISVGDRVIFPSSGEMMEGTVTKMYNSSCEVKNDSGYSKKKYYKTLVNISGIKRVMPELEL